MKLRLYLSAISVSLLSFLSATAQETEPLPFSETFSSQDGFNRFTVINANNDTDLYDDGTGNTTESPCTWVFDASRLCASYTYNKNNTAMAADDWLITPGFELEAGRTYTLTFLAGSANNQGESMEVKLGTSADVAGMTQSIMPNTDIKDKLNFDDFKGRVYTFDNVSVTASGVYYIGFHVTSPANHFRLMLDNIEFSANPFAAAPSAVTNLTVTPAAQGALSATISLTAPSTSIDGTALTSLNRIELKRGSQLINTFNRPAPGATLTFVDESPVAGNNTYSAIAYNEAGFGDAVEATAYIGLDVPSRPLGALAQDLQSSVALSWNAVGGTGLNGGYVDPSRVQYIIYSMEGGYVVDQLLTTAEGVTQASVEIDTEAGTQELKQFAIAAQNDAGRSDYGVAALVTGQSYRLPFVEHFSGSATQNYWYRYSTAGIEPSFDSESADGDGSSYKLKSTQAGAEVRFISGKISLRGALAPTLRFQHLGDPGSNSRLIIEVQKPNGDVETVKAIDYSQQMGAPVWNTESVSLTKFLSERYIMVSFHFASGAAGQLVNIDDISVDDVAEYDLSVSMEAPATVKKGSTATVYVNVLNNGSEAAPEYRVKLFADSEEVFNQRVTEPLASLDERTFTVELPVSPVSQAEKLALRAVVDFDYDLEESNNAATATVEVKGAGLPTVENLQGTQGDGTITITWNQPSSLSREYVESFESAEFVPFDNAGITSTNHEGMLGEWRINDADGKITFAFRSTPTYPTDGLEHAWFVVQPDMIFDLTTLPRMRAQDGVRYLMAMNAAAEGGAALTSNDWLISPRLSGEEQEISFWASEYSAAFDPEKFELYYSTTGPNLLNMTYIGQGTITEDRWQEQKFTVPQGTRYFAIRHVSENAWGMMVDNFKYRVGAGSVKAYNIYRDGQLIATVDGLDALTFTDTTDEGHVYYVTVVYSDGSESDAVQVVVGTVGINTLGAASTPAEVYDLQGRRVQGMPTKGIYVVGGRKVIFK